MAGRARRARTSPAANRRRRRPRSRRSGAGGRAQVLEVAAQLADLVAQPGGVLEAQLVGGDEHLLLELDDRALEVLHGHRVDVALAPARALLGHLRVALQELGDVRDAL